MLVDNIDTLSFHYWKILVEYVRCCFQGQTTQLAEQHVASATLSVLSKFVTPCYLIARERKGVEEPKYVIYAQRGGHRS